MRVLVDTHILIWLLARTARLPEEARRVLADDANVRLFSAVSIWEIAIKFSLRRPDFTASPREIHAGALRSGFQELPVTSAAAALVADMPHYHRDPFDRLLIAQAIEERAVLLTVDATLPRYSSNVLLVA